MNYPPGNVSEARLADTLGQVLHVHCVKFTVVIPLFNKQAYIQQTVASVLAQTFGDLEVVVVDDGSTDGGADLVSRLGDPRVILVRQANAGVSVARNHGIAVARGEWVAFLDADDWLHPRYLETLLKAHEAHPEADTIATGFLDFHATGASAPKEWPVPAEPPAIELITDLPTRWMVATPLRTSAIAVRRSRLVSMQPCFAPGESYGEDMELWFRIAERSPVALAHVPLMAYRVNATGSLTGLHDYAHAPNYHERMRKRALSGDLTEKQRRSALWFLAQQQLTLARHCVATGRRRQALGYLVNGFRAASGKRWWVTALMVLAFSSGRVRSWQAWRTAPVLTLTGETAGQ